MGNWCPPRASNPLLRANPTLGGFDSHTFPPFLIAEKLSEFLRCLSLCVTKQSAIYAVHKSRHRVMVLSRDPEGFVYLSVFISVPSVVAYAFTGGIDDQRFAISVLLLAGVCSPARGWLLEGHHILTLSAVAALPDEVPAFFRQGAKTVAHLSIDPDMGKNRGTPQVRGAEYPEHFLDREMLDVETLPASRYAFVKLCYEHGVSPEKMGFVPYAVNEWTERLAVAFAEFRKWPDNPHIQSKCLIYAGFLAHYAEDMCQPLHLTIHYDGRVQEGGEKLQRGIHLKVDGLVQFLKMEPGDLSRDQDVTPFDDVMSEIMREFEEGFALVDRVYEMGPNIPRYDEENWVPNAEVIAFAKDRARAATRFTARLYLTAWRLSERLEIADFVKREVWDGE